MTRYKDKFIYTIFLLLLMVMHPLQAAQSNQGTTFEGKEAHKKPAHQPTELFSATQNLAVYDHTLHIHKQVDNEVKAVDTLQEDLEDEMLPLANTLAKEGHELLLAAVLERRQDQKYYKYLFSNKGLVKGKEVVNKAYKKFRYHLMKTTSPHVVVALLEWLGWSQTQFTDHSPSSNPYSVKALHPSLSVCKSCHLLALHMFQIKLDFNKEGCQRQPFPNIIEALPPFAQQYINASLSLSLAQELIVPMMGYVKGSHIKPKEATKKNTIATAIKSRPKTCTILCALIVAGIGIVTKGLYTHWQDKNTTIRDFYSTVEVQNILLTALYADLEKEQSAINTKNQDIEKLKIKLQKKDKLIQPYYQQQQLSAQITKAADQFNTQLLDVNITDSNTIKAFVQQIEVHFQPLLEIRALHEKYKEGTAEDNEGWKRWWTFENKQLVRIKNSQGLYWYDTYNEMEEKLIDCTQFLEKMDSFFQILQTIDTLLSKQNSQLHDVKEALEKIGPKEATYQAEIAKLKAKLIQSPFVSVESMGWRWLV